jgi:hypothetical protein
VGFHEIDFFTFGIISVNFLPFIIILVGFHEIDFFTFGIISVNFLPFRIISVGFHEIDFFTFGIISVNFLPFGIISVGFHEIDLFTFGIISEMKFQRFAIISAIRHQPSSSSTLKRGYPLRPTVKLLRSLVQALALVLLLVTSRPLFISISASVI